MCAKGSFALHRKSVDPGRRDSEDDRVTLVPCVACGGEYRRKIRAVDSEGGKGEDEFELCAWCTRGSMTDAELQAWKVHRTTRRPPG